MRKAWFLTVAVLTAGLVVAVLVIQRSGPDTAHEQPRTPSGRSWEVLPPSPLSARAHPLTVAVGDEVLFIGGTRGPICPPGSFCSAGPTSRVLRDGAAYNVVTATWRRISSAPRPLLSASAVVVSGIVHVMLYGDGTGERGPHLAYDVQGDRWSVRAMPHQQGSFGKPFAPVDAGGRLVATGTGHIRDQVYDPVRNRWDELPPDPATPYEGTRRLAWTGAKLIAFGTRPPRVNEKQPLWQRATAFDFVTRTWTRLPDATTIIGTDFHHWAWDGSRLLNANQESFASRDNPPSVLRRGGSLDPDTGVWEELPAVPAPDPRKATDSHGDLARYRFHVTADGQRFRQSDYWLFFDTRRDEWLPTPTAPLEVGGGAGQAWVGDALVVWGGFTPYDDSGRGGGKLLATGAIYRPLT